LGIAGTISISPHVVFEVQRINRISVKTAKKYKIPVNDLYSFVKHKIGEDGMKKDGVHFLDGAYQKIGKQVSAKITEALI
jgi:lysophospholipase L1-like esterase